MNHKSPMSYGEKLTAFTCMFCGAPIELYSERCNYCNCHYISVEEFERIKSTFDFMNLTVIKCEIEAETLETYDIIYRGIKITQPSIYINPSTKAFLTLRYSKEAEEGVKEWLDSVHVTGAIGKSPKRDVGLNIRDKKILFENCLLKSLEVIRDERIEIGIVFDKVQYRKGE